MWREDKSAYRALFDHSSIGIVISDEDGVIEQANGYANHIFGYGEGELTGRRVEILVPPRLAGRHVDHRARYNQDPRPRAMGTGVDLWALRKDGSEFPVEISLASFERDGRWQIVSFVNDITKRKQAEEELRRLNAELEIKVEERTRELSQALLELGHINESLKTEMEQRKKVEAEVRRTLEREKELGELKSRFVSMASHEFRTPLGGIMTSAALIERYEDPKDADKRRKHVGTIKKAVHNLTNILNDFLSLDKLDQGKIHSHASVFGLPEFVRPLIDEMQEIAKGGYHIVYEHTGKPEGDVTLDREMFRNVLINLLSNAMKYSPAGAEIFCTTELAGDHLTLTVRDHGIGIPAAEQKHVFERFFRAKNAATTQGTGLGLNIVKRYLDLMGGTIGFSSEEGRGTTFTVTLPAKGV